MSLDNLISLSFLHLHIRLNRDGRDNDTFGLLSFHSQVVGPLWSDLSDSGALRKQGAGEKGEDYKTRERNGSGQKRRKTEQETGRETERTRTTATGGEREEVER